MISIGAVYHGPELQGSEINRAIMTVSKVMKEFRGTLKTGEIPWVNAVFVISGSLGKVDFSGLDYGEYSKKDKGVVVKIAVPAEVAIGDKLIDFVIDSLRGANAMAFEYFRQKGEIFPLKDAEDLVSQVSSRLHTN